MSPKLLVPALVASLCLGACGTFGGGGASTSDDELAALSRRLVETQQRAVRNEVELERLRRELAELRTRLGEPGRPAASAPTEVVPSPEPVRFEVLDEEPVEQDLPAPAGPGSSAGSASEGAEPPPPAALQALYDQGYALYHQGRYVEAEAQLQRVLLADRYSPLADNALFWIGASRLARGEVAAALESFRETVERYPDGNKVPDALLKVAECQERLGQREEALATYRRVVERYPSSGASVAAREKLTSGGG